MILENKKIKKYKYISFDIFDTLLERKVLLPSEIFRNTGIKVFGKKQGIDFFYLRQKAEKYCYKELGAKTSLDNIYEQLNKVYGEELSTQLKREEIFQELSNCYPKKRIKSLYDFANKQNKRILIISDMYLPSDVIKKMLYKCGYSKYEKLYVSNECSFSKKSGKLFNYVLNDQNISSDEILHIGDSITADILGAKKANINSIFVPKRKMIVRKIKDVL